MAPRRDTSLRAESGAPKLGVKPGVKPPPKKGRGRPRSAVFKCFTRHVDPKGVFLKNECNFCLFHSVDASENATYLKRHILSACGAAPEQVKATLLPKSSAATHLTPIPQRSIVLTTANAQEIQGIMNADTRLGATEIMETGIEPGPPPQQQQERLLSNSLSNSFSTDNDSCSVRQDVRNNTLEGSPPVQETPTKTARPRRGRKRSQAPLSFARNVDENGKFFVNICKYCSYVTKSENVTLLRNHLRSKDCKAPTAVLNRL